MLDRIVLKEAWLHHELAANAEQVRQQTEQSFPKLHLTYQRTLGVYIMGVCI